MPRPAVQTTPGPTWRGRLSHPLRAVVVRLIRPMFREFVWAYDELSDANAELSRQLDVAQRRIDRLTEEVAAANALVWDQVALSRRLAELEDSLATEVDGQRGSGSRPS